MKLLKILINVAFVENNMKKVKQKKKIMLTSLDNITCTISHNITQYHTISRGQYHCAARD